MPEGERLSAKQTERLYGRNTFPCEQYLVVSESIDAASDRAAALSNLSVIACAMPPLLVGEALIKTKSPEPSGSGLLGGKMGIRTPERF